MTFMLHVMQLCTSLKNLRYFGKTALVISKHDPVDECSKLGSFFSGTLVVTSEIFWQFLESSNLVELGRKNSDLK